MPLFEEIRIDVDTILTASTDLFEVREAADEIFLEADDLTDQARVLATEYGTLGDDELWPSLLAGLALAAAALAMLFLIGFGAYLAQRKRARATTEINQRNQDAILRLLDEMSSLADGDLTVQATVTEDVTGAIADSVNYAVEALRDLVAGVNSTAQQVAAQAQETRATTMQLAEASEHQAKEIREASDTINEMARSFDDMASARANRPTSPRTRSKSPTAAPTWCARRSPAWTTSATRSRKPPSESSAWVNPPRRLVTSLN
jgi:twitching motility protein PilJ